MKCPRCGRENREGNRFCDKCGAPLQRTCPVCQSECAPDADFCGKCGAPLTSVTATLPAAPTKVPSPPPTSAAPTSFGGGRYQVRKFLGEGGKKKVFLAQDTLLDRDVAFALIKSEGLDDTARQRIRREAQAMGRLGAHPHIVTVFDLGEESGQPFMVTEFMNGGDVEHLIDKAPNHKLAMERAIKLGEEVCQGLQYAHSRGIVHRDLKPGNVWLTADGMAKIGDFGLALPMDRSRLTREGMMVGTVAYMPPEQAMGGEVTPKADLYSLGCMLYECIAGRPPFLGDDPIAVIGQHIHTPPVAPSWHNPQCPRDLEALVLRLLAKDPAQRPESAQEVLTALEGVDLTAVAERAEDESRSLDSLAGGVFVGRQREMGELKAALEDALSGRGRLAMLVGEPGIGKTRTALELATYAGLRQAQVLWGRCYESQGMPAYWPWVQAIRSYVREHEPQRLRREMGSGAADIAEIVSDIRERIPDLKASPALEDPEAARFRLFDSIATFLKSASKSQPLVLILDDLQWADKSTLLLLQFVAGELASSRLLIIGTYRDVELSRKHPLAQALGDLTRERAFRRVVLRGLSKEDVGRFIELTAGVKPPDALVKAVYTQTEGNPMFVNEVVRLLVQEGELKPERAKSRSSWTLRIPEGVREVIGRRLNRLSERCNQALTIAAVLGREFTLEQLGQIVRDCCEDRLLEILEEGTAARVIEEVTHAAGTFQFTHSLIQETLVEELSLARRVRLHAEIAQALEALYAKDAPAHAAELAHHFGEAESLLGTEKLVRYSLLAGERALAGFACEEALECFERGLAAKEGQPIDADTAALCYGMGRAEAALMIVDPMVEHLTRAFGYYIDAGDVLRAVSVASVTVTLLQAYARIAPIVERALQLVPPDSIEAGRLLAMYARYLGMMRADYEGAERCSKQALATARRLGDLRLELRALAIAAELASVRGHSEEYEDTLHQAISLAATVDCPWDESLLHFQACYWYRGKADPEEAKKHGKAALLTAGRLRDRQRLSTAFHANQLLAMCLGDWDAAKEYSDRGLLASPDSLILPSQRMWLECELGNPERAEFYLEKARGRLAEWHIARAAYITGNAHWRDLARSSANNALANGGQPVWQNQLLRMTLAFIAADEGNAEEVRKQLSALQTMAPGFPEGLWALRDTRTRETLGIVRHAIGDLDEAARHFEDSLALSRKGGYRPELAWTCCDYADLLLDRKAPGDEERAMALLDESLAIAKELGMVPLMERVLSRRKILKA